MSSSPRVRLALLVLAHLSLGAFCYLLIAFDRGFRDDAAATFAVALHSDPAGAGGRRSLPATVSLPHRCPPTGDRWECSAVYRIGPVHVPADQGVQSLYIPRSSGHLRVLWNGTLLAESHWQQPAAHLGQNAPLLIPLPQPVPQGGANEIELVLESRLIFGGFLGAVHVGPDAVLREHHDRVRFMVVTLARLIDGWIIAMAFFLLLVWAIRPWDRVNLVFGAALLSYAAASLPAILDDAPHDGLLHLANLCRVVSMSLMLPFAWLFVGRTPVVPASRFLLLPLLAFLLVLALPGAWSATLIRFVVTPIMLLLAGAASLVLARTALRSGSDGAILLLGTMAAVIGFGLRDLLVLNGTLEGSHVLLARFSAPLIMSVVGCVLLWRVAAALTLAERFGGTLQQALAAREQELRDILLRERAQSLRAALEAERMRLMRDLHDGIGGQLLSILALSERGGERRGDAIAAASRRALADLRLVVDSLEDMGNDLGLMLGQFRERIELLLRPSGIRLDWRVPDLPELPGLTPAATLHIFRILQEAVTNATRHSGSDVIVIEAVPSSAAGSGVRLIVREHGRGGAAERAGGLGLANMRHRAATFGARLSIDSGPGGTAVVLELPHRLD
ncbi:hypothetical protein SH611_17160 [Geminicoccaceae bacterium 1502E]|nr:hypothetical protein [Geminicoccaceae bacterium 1502E]